MSKIEPNRQTTKSPNTISTGVHRIRTHSSEVLLYGHYSLLFRLLRCYCWRVARYTNLNNTNSIALWVQVLGKSMLIVVYVRSCEASNSSSMAMYSLRRLFYNWMRFTRPISAELCVFFSISIVGNERSRSVKRADSEGYDKEHFELRKVLYLTRT